MRSRTCFAASFCISLVGLVASDPATAGPRELSTDRPDVTESPYSVPPGWAQLEMDGLVWARDGRIGPDVYRTSRLALAPLNLKLGLAPAFDLQLVFEPWVRTRKEFIGACIDEAGFVCGPEADTTTGTGELAVRLKWNLIGNDGGRVALGVLPWISWDTSARGDGIADAAGLAIPVSCSLGEQWGMGAMVGGSAGEDEHAVLGTATLAHSFPGSVGVFWEVAAEHAWDTLEDSAATIATANSGLTVGIGSDLQLDGGVRVGISDAADGFTAFVGMAYRRKLR